jgi:hypothetical protein
MECRRGLILRTSCFVPQAQCSFLKDQKLRDAVKVYNAKNWKKIAAYAFDSKKTDVQCLHRWQKVLDPKLVKGPWTKDVRSSNAYFLSYC